MEDRYRIMVQGEDGQLFCVKNNCRDIDVVKSVEAAEADYPCGNVFIEDEGA